jgi:hypothetical protein
VELPEDAPEAIELFELLREKKVDLDDVEDILQRNVGTANVRESSFGWTPVLFAAHRGDARLLSLLLDSRADMNIKCNQGNTALHLAARRGNLDVLTLLHSRGADLEAQNAQGWTPLMWTAIAGHPSVASTLLDVNADANSMRDSGGRTATMWAARHGHTDILRSLLSQGADLSVRDEEGMTIQDHARYYTNMQKSIAASSADQESGDATYWALGQGSLDLERLLVQHGAGQASQTKEAPLHAVNEAVLSSQQLLHAARINDWEAAEEALRAGACVATKGESDQLSPLMWAAIHDAPASAFSLVAALADLEARDPLGWTALHHAVHAESAQTVAVLHYLGADFTARSDKGDTAQHLAALSDSAQMLQLLGPATSDWNVHDAAGLTPLQASASRGCLSAVCALLALKADAAVTDTHGQSVLALAASQGHAAVVRALVEPVEQLPVLWDEDELNEMLEKLPWVDSDVVDGNGHGHSHDRASANGSVCSGMQSVSSYTSSVSGRNGKLGTKLAGKLLQSKKQHGMHTIKEVDSEAGSTLSSARVGRPKSAGSHAPSVAHTHVSSQSRAASVAKSVQSQVSVHSAAKSNHSNVSTHSLARSAQSHVSLRSKTGSHLSVPHSRASGLSRRSLGGGSRMSMGGRSTKSNRISNMPATIYSMAVNVIGRSPVSLMNASGKVSAGPELPSPLVLSSALSVTDQDGSTPLALAASTRQFDVVRLLLELKADPDTPDLQGNTALMVAAGTGDKDVVTDIIGARASLDFHNTGGLQAIDLATNVEVAEMLQAEMDRRAVQKQVSKSCSLPSLVKAKPKPPPAKLVSKPSICRIRLDCASTSPAEQLDEEVRAVLKRYKVASPICLEVVVDPITLRSLGHVFLDYTDTEEAQVAAEILDDYAAENFTVSINGKFL